MPLGIGFHPGASRAAYEAVDGANYSRLKLFERSAAHVLEATIHPQAPTPALELGQHIHVAFLEPERLERDYAVAPKIDRRFTAGKAEWKAFEEANAGKELLSAENWELVRGIRDSAWSQPLVAELLRGKGHCEAAAVWEHERTGLACKGLIDRVTVHDGWTWAIDVKSTPNAAPGPFAAACARYQYHAQAAFYLGGLHALAPARRRFAWIAVEKEPPYAVAVYEPDEAALLAGETLIERWLDQYAAAKASGHWPGFPQKVQRLELPRWALREGEVV